MENPIMQIIVVTGMSGSGKSVAMKTLEDLGFYSIDNLLPQFFISVIDELALIQQTRIAISADIRSKDALAKLPDIVRTLQLKGHDVRTLFLTASTQTLIARFSETRRKHPLSHIHTNETLPECISEERELLAVIEGLGQVIDTSFIKPSLLRERIKDLLGIHGDQLTLAFESFAFKRGIPLDADLVFDARCLPNPFYEPELRPLTGRDQAVADYLTKQPQVLAWLDDIEQFLRRWLPSYIHDSRSYLTVAFGCTGGQHRSVFCVEFMTERFKNHHALIARHREIE